MMSATSITASNSKPRPANLRSSSTGTSAIVHSSSPTHPIQPLSAASTGSIDFVTASSAASVCSSDDMGIVSMSEADGSSSDADCSGPRSSSVLSATSWSDLDSPTSQSPGVLTSEPNSPVKIIGPVSKAVAMRLSPLPSPAIVASAGAVAATMNREGDDHKPPPSQVLSTANQVDEQQPSTLAWGLAKVVNLVTLSLLDPAIDPWVSDAPFNEDSAEYHSPRALATKSTSTKQRNTSNMSLMIQRQDNDEQKSQQQHVPSLSLATTLSSSHSLTDGSPLPLDLIDEDSGYLASPTSDDTNTDSSGGGFFKTLLSPISSRFRSWLTETSDDDSNSDDADHTDASFYSHNDMMTPAYEGSDPFAFSDFAARHHQHHRSDSYTLFDSSPLASPVASSSDAMDTLGMRLFASSGGAVGAEEAGTDGAYLRRWTPSPTVF